MIPQSEAGEHTSPSSGDGIFMAISYLILRNYLIAISDSDRRKQVRNITTILEMTGSCELAGTPSVLTQSRHSARPVH